MAYTYDPHTPEKRRFMPWLLCSGCGLVYLRNPLTDWCVRRGCNYDEHPDLKAQTRALSR